MLAEEREKAGTHLNDSFIPPAEREMLEQEQQAQATVDRLIAQSKARVEQATAPPPESLIDLINTGVDATQIAKMFHCTVEELYTRCDAEGLKRPPEHYPDLNTVQGTHERPLHEANERAINAQVANPVRGNRVGQDEQAEPEASAGVDLAESSLKDRVLELHGIGNSPGAIARELSRDDAPVTHQKVSAIIAQVVNA